MPRPFWIALTVRVQYDFPEILESYIRSACTISDPIHLVYYGLFWVSWKQKVGMQ